MATVPSQSLAEGILAADARALADHFRTILVRYREAPARLMESIAYSLLAGGKRLRPALVLETSRMLTGGTVPSSALAAAAAVELVHTFSLVHDDLPAMDNDDLRRGRPTNHKVFGEALAILGGDAMVTIAFELLATDASPVLAARLVRELAAAAGPEGMIGGQVLDMEGEHKHLRLLELKDLHRRKTGALLMASCRMGAIAAEADEQALVAVSDFGRHLGLAFQIVDDILDVTSTPDRLGKATAKDVQRGKNTYPGLIGLEESRDQARRELAAALEVFESFGSSADGLRSLACFVVDRTM